MSLIELENVTYHYPFCKEPALRQISCTFEKGKFYGIIGENGGGKTSLCNLLRGLIPLPIPAGIYGFALLFILLCTGVLKLHQVAETADLLVEIMQLILLPACISLMDYWSELAGAMPALLTVCVVSTAVVMGVTGKVSDRIIGRKGGEDQ